jgi:tRNA A-37 threonylcarbamoyl transferase component Bud32
MKTANLKQSLIARIKQTRRRILLRVSLVGFVLFPVWIFVVAWSFLKTYFWRSGWVCRKFIRRRLLAFEDVDASSLTVRQISGGLNNLNEVWRLRKKNGQELEYCVKVFLPLGSLWARVNFMASPFPYVHDGRIQERFTVDLISRAQLGERGIFVPKLIAFGAHEKVMVTEHIRGIVVDDVLKAIEQRQVLTAEDAEVIGECGRVLAHIHTEGFSLIDTQPVNCIWVPETRRVYFIDLEFCVRSDYRVWDVAFFLISVLIRLPERVAPEAKEIFLKGYQRVRPIDLAKIEKLDRQLREYIPIFLTILDIRQFTPGALLRELMR